MGWTEAWHNKIGERFRDRDIVQSDGQKYEPYCD